MQFFEVILQIISIDILQGNFSIIFIMKWSVFILLCVLYTFVKTAEQKPLMADSEIQCIFLLV